MPTVAQKRLTFEEFARLNGEGRYELVDGRLEELVPPRPRHGWTYVHLAAALVPYLEQHHPGGYWGGEVDIPTIPFHGRRPDFIFFTREAAERGVDLDADRVLAIPTLAIEILSEGDEERDRVTKRREYAVAGIQHYWILDPGRRRALLLGLEEGAYIVEAEFSGAVLLTARLFPGLEIPHLRLFR